jgi:YidC/Oxa1 family membrane protein insertase
LPVATLFIPVGLIPFPDLEIKRLFMDTRRLMLLFVFALSLFMLWDGWQKQQRPSVSSAASAPTQTAVNTAENDASIPEGVRAMRPIESEAAADPGTPPVESIFVSTDLVKAEISARGGDLVWLELEQFRANEDKPFSLFGFSFGSKAQESEKKPFALFAEPHRYVAQSGLLGAEKGLLPDHKTLLTPLPGPRALIEGEDSLQVRLAAPEVNGVRATKVYTFHRGSYLIDVSWEIENGSDAPLQANAYFQLQRDGAAPGGDSSLMPTFYGVAVYTEAEKYQKVSYDEIAEDRAKFNKQANNGWLAMVQHYFVAAWAPQGDVPRDFYMKKISGGNDGVERSLFTAGVVLPIASIAPSGKGTVNVPLFAGPQIQSALKQVASGLNLVVDYGWLHIIAAPIFWALEFINTLMGNWGWSIVVLTVLIKLLFFPLSAASYKSMAKMRTLTPKMMQLKERYASDKARLNQEMMKLYQTEKINPLGGCLPILVQIPVFIALYWVLLGAVEMRDAPWIGWITDLSAADPYSVLPIVMMVSMFIQTRLNPTPPDPIQAKMMLIMPLVFGVMFFAFPAGLVLYWVVNNLLSIAQQWQINRMLGGGNKPKQAANDPKM